MKHLFLMTLIALSSAPGYAEWVEIGTTDNGSTSVYFDPDSIRRKGEMVKMWIMFDSKKVQSWNGLSVMLQQQIDCGEDRYRYLAIRRFSGNMGTGRVIYTNADDTAPWRPVAPGSVSQVLWKVACTEQ